MSLVSRFTNQVRHLFSRDSTVEKPSPLSASVVTHELLDEGVLSEFRERATRFDATFTNLPEIEMAPAEYDEDGNESKPADVRPYEPAPDLYSDLFYSLFGYAEPEIRPREEVLPHADLHRRVMEQIIYAEDFQQVRPRTRFDEVSSALATMQMVETVNEALQTTLREHAERAEDMQQQQDAMIEAAAANDAIRQEIADQGGQPTQEQKDDLRANAQDKYDARQKLEELAQQAQQNPPGAAIAEAAQQAVEAAKDTVNVFSAMPGSGTGAKGLDMTPGQAIEYAEAIKSNPRIYKVLEMLGRFERDMRYKRTNRIVGGREEPVDIMLGNDLGLALPTELMKLRHPLLRLDFMRRYYEGEILQHEMIGHAEAGKGPIVVCIDCSSSMSGGKIEWARAVALALVSIAHREKRHAAMLDYDTQVKGTWEFPARQAIDAGQVIEFAGRGSSGGTDITVAMDRAKSIIDQHPDFKKADIVLVSDGEDSYGAPDIALHDEFIQRGIRVHGVGIKLRASTYLDSMCESWVPVEDLAQPSQATDHLAAVMT